MSLVNEELSDNIVSFFSGSPVTEELLGIGLFLVDFRKKNIYRNSQWKYCAFNESSGDLELISEVIDPDQIEKIRFFMKKLEEGKIDRIRSYYRIKNLSGEWLWIFHRGHLLSNGENGKPRLYIGFETDITYLKEAELDLLEQKKQTEIWAKEAETLLHTGALITSSIHIDETIELILEQMRLVIPYERATVQFLSGNNLTVVGGNGFDDLSLVMGMEFPFPEEGSLSTNAIEEHRPVICNDMEKEFPAFRELNIDNPTRSWMGIPLIYRGDVTGLLALDHTERNFYGEHYINLASGFASFVSVALANARHHAKTHKMAMEDSLMKIGSRSSFDLQGKLLFSKAKRMNANICLAIADLDYFKKINDTYGHNVGDMVLREVGAICRKEVRDSDIVARFGGEEIVFMFLQLDLHGAVSVMQRLRQAVAEHDFGNVKKGVTISAGLISGIPGREDELEDLLSAADDLLYQAKREGRDRVVAGKFGGKPFTVDPV